MIALGTTFVMWAVLAVAGSWAIASVAGDAIRAVALRCIQRLYGLESRPVEATAGQLGVILGADDGLAADLAARTALGVERYGEPLRSHNGRDAVLDASEEVADGIQYVTQAWMEGRLTSRATIRALRGLVAARKALREGSR